MSTHVTIKVPVNAKSCLQMAYDVLLSPENLLAEKISKKSSPYMDELLLHAFVAHSNRFEYLVTVKEVSQNESEMTVICAFQNITQLNTIGPECELISLFLRILSQKIQNTT